MKKMPYRIILAAFIFVAAPPAIAQNAAQLREIADNFGLTPKQARHVFAMYDSQASRIASLADTNKIDKRLLRSAALRLGAKNPNLDPNEFLRLVESKAVQASSAQAKIVQLEGRISKLQHGDMRAYGQAALAEAHIAFDEGRLEDAERALARLNALRQSDLASARDAWKEAVFAQMELLALAGENERASEIAERAARDIADQARHDAWAFAIADAHQWFQRGDLFGERQALERSIGILRTRALALAPADGAIVDWAITQNEIGNVLLVSGQRISGNSGLEQAAAVYRSALQKLSRETSPPDWAMLQNNLCGALLALGQQKQAIDILQEAVAACRASLQEVSKEGDTQAQEAAQENLGKALIELGVLKRDVDLISEGMRRGRPVLPAAVDAPKVKPVVNAPNGKPVVKVTEYASDDEMEAQIHRPGEIEDELKYAEYLAQRLEYPHAIWHYRRALTATRRQKAPMEWARIQFDLGNILQKLGRRPNGADDEGQERLQQAIASYTSALEIYRRDQVPRYFAMVQRALATTFKILGEAYLDDWSDKPSLGLQNLHQSIGAYRAAADGLRDAGAMSERAITLADLGCTLIDLSLHENRDANLKEAVSILEPITKEFGKSADRDGSIARFNAESCLSKAKRVTADEQ